MIVVYSEQTLSSSIFINDIHTQEAGPFMQTPEVSPRNRLCKSYYHRSSRLF